MAELSIVASITRAELLLAPLPIEVPGQYQIIRETLGPGSISWRRQTARSAYVHGEVLVGLVKDITVSTLGVRVLGSSAATLWSRMNTLLRAFEQYSYDLSVTLDGQTFTWRCQAADYAVGESGVFQDFHLRSLQQEVRFSIPRHPTPVAGPT